jgi:hypothetical protein
MPRSLTNAYWIHVGELRERERIIALLEDRYSDLMSCLKDDDCKTLAHIVSTCIEDITEENESKNTQPKNKPKHPFEYEGWND